VTIPSRSVNSIGARSHGGRGTCLEGLASGIIRVCEGPATHPPCSLSGALGSSRTLAAAAAIAHTRITTSCQPARRARERRSWWRSFREPGMRLTRYQRCLVELLPGEGKVFRARYTLALQRQSSHCALWQRSRLVGLLQGRSNAGGRNHARSAPAVQQCRSLQAQQYRQPRPASPWLCNRGGATRSLGGVSWCTSRLPNQRIELTRRAGCLLGGSAFGHHRGMQRLCNSPAAHLIRNVRRPR
jgi:hypothetical protein